MSKSTACDDQGRYTKECFSFSVEDLCNKPRNDHNYYAICAVGPLIIFFTSIGISNIGLNSSVNLLKLFLQGLLAPGALAVDYPQGLLHSVPTEDKDRLSQLPDLLLQCKDPSHGKLDLDRILAAQRLITILEEYQGEP